VSVIFHAKGKVNGKQVWLVQKAAKPSPETVATISFDGCEWLLRYERSGRIERFDTVAQAKDEARKI